MRPRAGGASGVGGGGGASCSPSGSPRHLPPLPGAGSAAATHAAVPQSLPAASSPPPLPHLAGGTPGGPAPLWQLGGHFPSRRRKRRGAQREKEKTTIESGGRRPPPRARHFRPGRRNTGTAHSPGAILVLGSRPQGRWRPAALLADGRPPPGLCPGRAAWPCPALPYPPPPHTHTRSVPRPGAPCPAGCSSSFLLPHRRD